MAYHLLWADDEIELLNAHIIFLQAKGYEVTSVTNGLDAIEACRNEAYDLILLDENMPGLNGLETLVRIKEITPTTPVVMVTKSEEEDIMEQAIGSKIADYHAPSALGHPFGSGGTSGGADRAAGVVPRIRRNGGNKF